MSNTTPIRRESGGGGGGGGDRGNRTIDLLLLDDENDNTMNDDQSSPAAAVITSSSSSSPSSPASSSSSSISLLYCNNNNNSSSSNNNNRKGLFLIPLTFIWWGASAWNSVDAKRAAKADPNCISIMAAASNWLGLVFFVILKLRQEEVCSTTTTSTTSSSRIKTTTTSSWREWTTTIKTMLLLNSMWNELWDIRYLSAAHAMGLFAAYKGLVQGRVALVQAIKATEPLIAMMMSGFFYKQYPSDFRIVLSVLVVVGGTICVLVEDTTFTYRAMMWTFISSFTTQGRNQIMKHRQQQRKKGIKTTTTAAAAAAAVIETGANNNNNNGSTDSSSGDGGEQQAAPSSSPTPPTTLTSTAKSPAMVGLLMFISTSAAAFIMNIIFLILQFAIQACCSATGLPLSSEEGGGSLLLSLLRTPATATAASSFPTYHVIMAGIYHFVYNMASFAVLSLVDMPTTHSLANTAKRAVIIGIASWQLQEPLTPKASIGLLFVIIGSACYGYYSKLEKTTTTTSNNKNKTSSTTTTTTTPAGGGGMQKQQCSHWYNYSDVMSRYYLKHLTLIILALVVFFQTKNISSALRSYSSTDGGGTVVH